jgi:ABC-type branched-subunit amino acid transport system substrate-binding protein
MPTHVGLLLPLNGPYAPFAERILLGARGARAHLAGAGVPVGLTVVDTSARGWLADYEAMPRNARIVGGMLRPETLGQAVASAGGSGRVHLAYLSELPDAVVTGDGSARQIVEGRDAWRFFTSPADNVRALLDGADRAGVRDLGVLYPDEPFGRRRAELFRRMASSRGLSVVATQAYDSDDPASWSRSTASLVADGRRAGTEIRGVYIPDVLPQARRLVPNLLVEQERRCLVLGSALWAQTMEVRHKNDALLLNHAVFPAAWWGESDAPMAVALRKTLAAMKRGSPGYWEALGFDFVRLASRMAATGGAVPEEVSKTLGRASRMAWAMAPMRWDAHGRARQDLHLLTPALYGPLRADLDSLRRSLHGTEANLSNHGTAAGQGS